MAKTPGFTLPFTKMHGLGNDFIVIDDFGPQPATAYPLDAEISQKLCDRHFGVGADQILWLKKPQNPAQVDVQMDILNADGSAAEMCGNGIRAVALYLKARYFTDLKSEVRGEKPAELHRGLKIETLGGIKTVHIRKGEQGEDLVRVDMGAPRLEAGFRPSEPEILQIGSTPVGGLTLGFHEVSMGNPHAVIFVDTIESINASELGPLVECHPRFPKRTNVEWVQITGPNSIRVKVWERGAGETLACGTGACAAAAAALATERVRGEIKVSLPGGVLRISWTGGKAPVMMEGTAEEVFQGHMRFTARVSP
jgi:diaminopimelate epimerase